MLKLMSNFSKILHTYYYIILYMILMILYCPCYNQQVSSRDNFHYTIEQKYHCRI